MAGHIDLPGTRVDVQVSAEYIAAMVVAAGDAVAAFNAAPSNGVPGIPPQYVNNAWLLATLVQGAHIEACYVAMLARWGRGWRARTSRGARTARSRMGSSLLTGACRYASVDSSEADKIRR